VCRDGRSVWDSLHSLSQLLHLVGFRLGRSLHGGDELLFSAVDLLLLNGDLLLPLHHLDLNLLQTDLLLLFGRLQFVRQLSLCFLERPEAFINTLLSRWTRLKSRPNIHLVPWCSLPG